MSQTSAWIVIVVFSIGVGVAAHLIEVWDGKRLKAQKKQDPQEKGTP